MILLVLDTRLPFGAAHGVPSGLKYNKIIGVNLKGSFARNFGGGACACVCGWEGGGEEGNAHGT